MGSHLGEDHPRLAFGALGGRVEMQPELDGGGLAAGRHVADRLQQGRTVSHMDAVEQAVSAQAPRFDADETCRGGACIDDAAIPVMPGHEVVDGREQHAVAQFVVAHAGQPTVLVAQMLQGLGGHVTDGRDGEDRHRQGAGQVEEGQRYAARRQEGDDQGADHRDEGGGQRRAA